MAPSSPHADFSEEHGKDFEALFNKEDALDDSTLPDEEVRSCCMICWSACCSMGMAILDHFPSCPLNPPRQVQARGAHEAWVPACIASASAASAHHTKLQREDVRCVIFFAGAREIAAFRTAAQQTPPLHEGLNSVAHESVDAVAAVCAWGGARLRGARMNAGLPDACVAPAPPPASPKCPERESPPPPRHPRSILSPEALLSTLEACGIDNARIEIEGGSEVPVIDGSAMGWAVELRSVGVRPCGPQSTRAVWLSPPQPLTVGDGDAFITFYPGDVMKLTAGVEFEVGPGQGVGADGRSPRCKSLAFDQYGAKSTPLHLPPCLQPLYSQPATPGSPSPIQPLFPLHHHYRSTPGAGHRAAVAHLEPGPGRAFSVRGGARAALL